jgi:hypothetical protein
MKNVAIIPIRSVKFSDDIIDEMGEQLRKRLQECGIKCGSVAHDFKLFMGSIFEASTTSGRFLVTVSVDTDDGPVTVLAKACTRFLIPPLPKQTIPSKWWNEFGEAFHDAVESEFKVFVINWLTEEEWLSDSSYP